MFLPLNLTLLQDLYFNNLGYDSKRAALEHLHGLRLDEIKVLFCGNGATKTLSPPYSLVSFSLLHEIVNPLFITITVNNLEAGKL
jgi:hypothetical protein